MSTPPPGSQAEPEPEDRDGPTESTGAGIPPGNSATQRPSQRFGRSALRAAEAAARVGLVLVLLGVTAYGLSGRRDLDWSALSDSSGDTWAGLVLVAMAAFVIVLAIRTVMRLLRETPAAGGLAAADVETARRPWWVYPVAVVVCIVALLLVYQLVHSAGDVRPHLPRPQAGNGGGPLHTGPTPDTVDKGALGLAVVAGVVLALAVSVAQLRRRVATVAADEPDEEQGDENDALARAVAAAEEVLDAHGDDSRSAIIAAYRAMEGQLVASGTTRRGSDTPTEFLERAIRSTHVSRGAATRLTELFREARFSTHPMPAEARDDAARALARVADDLIATRTASTMATSRQGSDG